MSVATTMRSRHEPLHGVVADSIELRRVLNLPEKESPDVTPEELSSYLGATSTVLWDIQCETLSQLFVCDGCFAAIGVGRGKTLISYLAPRIMEARRALLIIPSKLTKKTEREFAELAKEFGHIDIEVRTVTSISRNMYMDYRCQDCGHIHELRKRKPKKCTECQGDDVQRAGDRELNEIQMVDPDLLIIDEAHKFKNTRAACTTRLRHWRRLRPEVPMLVMSGTITNRSLLDFWHLLEMVLGPQRMPLPASPLQVSLWARAVDEKVDVRAAPGALSLLLPDNTKREIDDYRSAVGERIFKTPGVVRSVGEQCNASIEIELLKFPLPTAAEVVLRRYEREKKDVHGVDLTPSDLWRKRRTLLLGFEEYWEDPGPEDWLAARRGWKAMAREWMELEIAGLDTELRVANAASRGEIPNGRWQRWNRVKDTFKPKNKTVWYTDEVMQRVIDMAANDDVWIWTHYRAPGVKLQKMAGWPFFHQKGMCGKKFVEDHRKGPAVLSIHANLEGRNIQYYHKNIILSLPPSGEELEQLIGRTHREGQQADTVGFKVFEPLNAQDLAQALADARYQASLNGSPKKLLLADIIE